MRKILFFGILSILLSTATISAQRNYKKEILVGGRGGVTLSRVSFNPSVPQNYLLGYTAGVTFRYIEEKYFGFQLELNLAQHGWKEKFEEDPYNYSRTLNYLELPFMTHLFFGNHVFRGFVNLGPQIGLFLSEKRTSDLNFNALPSFTGNHSQEQLTLPVAHKIDYGICGGAGIELRAKKNVFILEGRYYFGLGDIFGSRPKDYFQASSNQNIYLAFSYMFNLK